MAPRSASRATGRWDSRLDFGYAPNFFSAEDEFFDLDGELNITTLMANITFGGAPMGGGVRPFFSGGAGLIRASVTSPGDLFDDVTRNDFGINVGGGLSGYFNDHVGIARRNPLFPQPRRLDGRRRLPARSA